MSRDRYKLPFLRAEFLAASLDSLGIPGARLEVALHEAAAFVKDIPDDLAREVADCKMITVLIHIE